MTERYPAGPTPGSRQGPIRAVFASLKELRWRGYVPALLVLLIGAAGIWVVYLEVTGLERDRVESAFADAARNRILAVQREVRAAREVVQDLAGFFDASSRVTRRQFREYVQPVLNRDPAIRFLAWVPRVPAQERDSFLADARQSFPRLEIWSDTPAELPPGAPTVHFPLLYLQPYELGETPLGLDLATLPGEPRVLERAASSGRMQLLEDPSPRLAASEEAVFEVYYPVYRHAPNNDGNGEEPGSGVQPRRGELRGFAVGRFLVARLIARALSHLSPAGIDMRFSIEDREGRERLLHWHSSRSRTSPLPQPPGEGGSGSRWEYGGEIAVADGRWLARCTSVPDSFRPETWVGRVIVGGGIAVSLLLAGYLLILERSAARVRRLVAERTSELEIANAALNRQVVERMRAERALQTLNVTLEQRVARRSSEAERRAAELEQFAYVASHDLKAPLRAIANLAQWLEEDLADRLTDQTREQLSLLQDRVGRMHRLVEGLLTYSRVGRTEGALEEVDSGELVSQTLDSLAPPQGFEFDIGPDMPVLVTDGLQLGQVFANLIGNSIKHHHRDRGHVRIAGRDLGDYCEFSVADDGPGIAPEYHDKVFKMFQILQVKDSQSDTGIGLALVKKIVEEHGGRIELTSAEGRGSTFRFTWYKEKGEDGS